MKCFWLLLLVIAIGIDAKGLFKYKSDTLNTFNGARRLLASGSLKTLIDVINGIGKKLIDITGVNVNLKVPEFGPAANMHKLRWSPKLEHVAYEYGKGRHLLDIEPFNSVSHKGFAGFQWKGLLMELIKTIVKGIPVQAVELILKPVLNILDKFLTALLLMVNYPGEQPLNPIGVNLGATEVLFAHRYEIGCYAKLTYAVCFMEPSRNGGYLYQPGIPCSNCTTHCEFAEDNNGIITEGDLCEAPLEDSNSTTSLEVKKESLTVSETSNNFKIFLISSTIGLMHFYL